MKFQYVVILKKTGQRATDVLSFLLCIISALILFYLSFRGGSRDWLTLVIAGLLVVGPGIVVWSRGRMRPEKVRYRYVLLLAAMGWMFFTPAPWVGALFFILTFLEYQTKRPLEIGFDNERVVINTLFKQQFDWGAFNNVILKDGLLTLDFKTNRLIQREVRDDEEEEDADEEEFNTYCRARLAAAGAG